MQIIFYKIKQIKLIIFICLSMAASILLIIDSFSTNDQFELVYETRPSKLISKEKYLFGSEFI
jgi:hypothetical protein